MTPRGNFATQERHGRSGLGAYEKAAREPGVTSRVRLMLEHNLNDERRHRAWIEQRLAAMSRTTESSRAAR